MTTTVAAKLTVPLVQPAKFQPRGIYRPNAQRLSLSLAPLVAQRSLLFRIKADLATKTSYGQLSPTCESREGSPAAYSASSPALFVLTATTTAKSARSARLLSTAVSSTFSGGALSTASVWSQDSWKGEASPFVSQTQTESQAKIQEATVVRRSVTHSTASDNRRHAVAFSPSINWDGMTGEELEKLGLAVVSERKESDAVEVGSHLATQVAGPVPSPLIKVTMVSSKNRDGFFGATSTTFDSNSSVAPSAVISVSTNDLALNFKFPAIASKQVDQHPASSSNKLVKSNPKSANSSEDTIQKRVSKHSKTFGKVIGHLSMQPLKKEKDTPAQQKRQTTPFMSKHSQQLLAVPEYSLPPLKASMSPIRMSFIASAGAAGTINAQLRSFSTALPTIPARAALPPPAVPVPAVNVMPPPQLSVTPASNRPQQQPQHQPLLPSQIQANIVNNPARVRPPRSIPPPALSLNGAPGAFLPEKKGHKRYQSSPAVTNFYLKGWDVGEEVPPVPPVPALPLMAATATTVTRKPRARSRSVAAGRGLVVPPVPAIPNAIRA